MSPVVTYNIPSGPNAMRPPSWLPSLAMPPSKITAGDTRLVPLSVSLITRLAFGLAPGPRDTYRYTCRVVA